MEKSVLEEVVEGESGGEARIGELGGAVVVVDEVDAARRRVAHLPAGRQLAEVVAATADVVALLA